ncbi:MAG: nitroreductase [Candidatus Aminicenantes bacterium]|nr:nitroreductase [Candidatus Aminicenantes bacterium]
MMEKEKYSQPVIDLIKNRSSIRSYESRPLDAQLREIIRIYLEAQTSGPLGHIMRFHLIEKDDPAILDNARLGTYGFIKNARYYIVGTVVPGEKHWEDYGYLLEKIILKMTDLELGTCWMGGSFKRSEFGKTINVLGTEVIPAITPVGYSTLKRSLRDRTIRWAAKSHSRKVWESLFFEDDFQNQLRRDKLGEYAVVLDMVRLAPSASNKQPWRVVYQKGQYHFFLQRTPNYAGHIKSADLQRVDIGIAMAHFGLTARDLGLNGTWEDIRPEMELPQHCEYCITWKERSTC